MINLFIHAAMLMTTPILLAAIGGFVNRIGGLVNLGLESMMLAGALVAVEVSAATGSAMLATVAAARVLIPRDAAIETRQRVDYIGSALVTSSLMLAVYAIVQATTHGWGSSQVLGFGAVAAALMAVFLWVEARVANPIMPLRILRLRRLVGASVVRALLVTGMYSTFFLGTIYLEHVLHYSAIEAGAADVSTDGPSRMASQRLVMERSTSPR